MMKMISCLKMAGVCASLAVFLFSADAFAAPKEGKKKKADRPVYAVIQKDGQRAMRRCFRDNDKNGFCDNGSEQKWKCKKNCRLAPPEDKPQTGPGPADKQLQPQTDEKEKKLVPACSACPLAGHCSGACAALFRKREAISKVS